MTYFTIAVVDTVLAAADRTKARRFSKPLLMPVLARGKRRPVQRALALSWLGDVALLGEGEAAFTAGLGSFLGAHIAWMVALRTQSTKAITWTKAAPYLVAWIGLNAVLWSRTGKDRPAVIGYSTALLGTALAGLDTGRNDLAAGGVLFLISDSLLALQKFADLRLPGHEGLVMASYTAGQALLARV